MDDVLSWKRLPNMRPVNDAETKLGLRKAAAPGFKRLRLTLSYCGTPWRGWQGQESGDGIQDVFQESVLKATGFEVKVHGSGRTDAGVHAYGQVAHVDVPDSIRMNAEAWRKALNACLPLSIRVTDLQFADDHFHARFDAVGKTYRYRIWRPQLLSPFEADRAWHIYGPLDMQALHNCAQKLVGTHNFVRLSANRGDMPEEKRRALPEKTTRTIHRAEISETDDVIQLEFEGDGFLYKMVRMIVGSLMQVARGRASTAWFSDLLSRSDGPQTHQTAPACGLYLMHVSYPGEARLESKFCT